MTTADLYLRLSDLRGDELDDNGHSVGLAFHEEQLRGEAAGLGWAVGRVIVENDMKTSADGRARPVSAYKTKLVAGPDGRVEFTTNRPGFNQVLADLASGAADALIAMNIDRLVRNTDEFQHMLNIVRSRKLNFRDVIEGGIRLTAGGTKEEISAAWAAVLHAIRSSDDTSRRIKVSRKRQGEAGWYFGGRRPYGYRFDPAAPKYHKTLIIVEDEAAVIRKAAGDILDREISLKAVAAQLRADGTPTVTGAAWTASTLRDALAKPAVTALAAHRGTLHEAKWAPILKRDQWERLTSLFDSRKNPGTSNAPRWLVSCYATCGVCGGPVKCTGASNRRAYTCTGHGHVRRNAEAVDEYVSAHVVERLSLPDAADLLRPPPRPGVDAAGLRAEAKRLRAKSARMGALFAADAITEAQLTSGTREIRDRLAKIDAQLAASDQPDPLAEFRDRPAAAVWESLSLPRRRAVVRLLCTVTILPAGRKGAGFDPASVRVLPVAGTASSG